MISPVSFGSTYKAFVTQRDCNKGIYAHQGLTDFCDNKGIYCGFEATMEKPKSPIDMPKPKYEESIGERTYAAYTVVAPDKYDSFIETIFANQGIKYNKIDSKSLTSTEAIKDRIIPKDGMELAFVNAEKLEKLAENQDSNFEHYKQDYDDYYKKNAQGALKSGDKFSTETLYINYHDDDGTPESLKRYVDTFGRENINSNSIGLTLCQEGRDNERGVYFAMKDEGMKEIPVYMNKESYKNAKTLGLIE